MNEAGPLFDAQELARWAHGEWTGDPSLRVEVCGVSQDTRTLKPGYLYVAIRGERFDGHAFVEKAFELGAAGALVDQAWQPATGLEGLPLIRVADTRKALQELAHAWRMKSAAKIIGLTGSSGKTTTKEMTAACLSGAGRVCATEGNLNNDIGLPLSLLKMSEDTAYGVFEAGMNHRGEISVLADILKPQGAVISSIGNAHIEFLDSIENIAHEKADLLRVLPQEGFAVLCRETTCFDILAKASAAPVITTSFITRDANFFGEILNVSTGMIRIHERDTDAAIDLSCGLPGAHNASNALLAFATARCAGVTAQQAVAGIQHVVMPGKRWEVIDRKGVTIVNDAYNANPDSMIAVMKTFMTMPCKGRRILVLGDMRELGSHSESLHRLVGQAISACAPDAIFAVGEMATSFMADEAIACGFPAARVQVAQTTHEAAQHLSEYVREGDSVLLKASRGMTLENILDAWKI
ncbi:MAG: UDP-N-acetylmuramoyl-tripeptide--D-alanyl-D-alanine ligase [bacterium]